MVIISVDYLSDIITVHFLICRRKDFGVIIAIEKDGFRVIII